MWEIALPNPLRIDTGPARNTSYAHDIVTCWRHLLRGSYEETAPV